ncbi:Acetamidase/formamidase [Sanguibacter gelidistatuariae]|uniref:Acetamidase/formamidase n=1 Tax=Sanguibacter gelidistatuariae TaxID=1814289 RepID=A0A1G6GQV1_9MICO|nr:acetamidase/formamidase family protein [Sanguibacter gelidistatuariae]SDB84380.1 Acetamidase/formamidase [Sanguibacter gelidistatuariae]
MTTTAERIPVLQPLSTGIEIPGHGRGSRPGYLPATPRTVLWGRLPCADDSPVLSINAGESLWIDTVSHEGILEDQGRDPVTFFGGHGVPSSDVLHDAVRVAAEVPRDPLGDGPHVVTGPIEIRGARVGDVLTITVLDLELRTGYGIVSNRHGRGALPVEFPVGGSLDPVSILCTVDAPVWPSGGASVGGSRTNGASGTGAFPSVASGAVLTGSIAAGPGDRRRVRFPLRPFLGTMGVAVAGTERAHSVPPGPRTLWGETEELLIPIGLDVDLGEAMRQATRGAIALLTDAGMDPTHAYAYLSAAGDFAVSQVVDRVSGVHGKIRKADLVELLEEPGVGAWAPSCPATGRRRGGLRSTPRRRATATRQVTRGHIVLRDKTSHGNEIGERYAIAIASGSVKVRTGG